MWPDQCGFPSGHGSGALWGLQAFVEVAFASRHHWPAKLADADALGQQSRHTYLLAGPYLP